MRRDDDAFDDRKKSQEAKFKMDEERRFKVKARRNKLAGLWAAGRLGLAGEAARAFAADVVMLGLDAKTDADFLGALALKLNVANRGVADGDLAARLAELEAEASAQIAREFPKALDGDHRPVGDGPHARRG